MTKLKINTHSGSQYETEVTSYNAVEINEKLNRNDVNTVAFGDIIISRIDVKSVAPIPDDETTDPVQPEETTEEPKVEEPLQEDTPIVE